MFDVLFLLTLSLEMKRTKFSQLIRISCFGLRIYGVWCMVRRREHARQFYGHFTGGHGL